MNIIAENSDQRIGFLPKRNVHSAGRLRYGDRGHQPVGDFNRQRTPIVAVPVTPNPEVPLQSIDFYNDYKYCPECDEYVTYLMSIHTSYCTKCGGEVRLFSKKDWDEFNRAPGSEKAKRGTVKRKTKSFGRAQ